MVNLGSVFGPEVTNTSGTAKVVGSNLTTCFFSNGKFSVLKKLSAYCLSAFVGVVARS